jgi:hypothetical protein
MASNRPRLIEKEQDKIQKAYSPFYYLIKLTKADRIDKTAPAIAQAPLKLFVLDLCLYT